MVSILLMLLFGQTPGSTTVDLIKLIPDGLNVIGVIVVVMLFLKQQDKFNVVLKSLTDDFHTQTKANQTAFQNQIAELTSQFSSNQKVFQDQIQVLMEAHIKISRETIITLNKVQSTVNELKDRMQIVAK
jgi:hypothetical protein